MKVVEVIAALRTDTSVCDALASLSERFGHAPVRAADTPGFIVNHAGRGYVTEGLRILAEGTCEPAVLDAVLRDACGFKLGPCELLDLTGLDVSHPVMESIYHQYYEEPRYRPQVVTQRMLDAGLLGRKRSAGFYRYIDGQQMRPPGPDRPSTAAPHVWIDPSIPELAARVAPALAPGAALDNAPRPTADSLIVVTPIGGDTTRAIVASDLDPRRTVGIDALFPGKERRQRRLSGARFSRADLPARARPHRQRRLLDRRAADRVAHGHRSRGQARARLPERFAGLGRFHRRRDGSPDSGRPSRDDRRSALSRDGVAGAASGARTVFDEDRLIKSQCRAAHRTG